ncbi:biotin-dependent carboxyltransferase family protein [Vibrio lentus]|uniref:5-oxoprolinase subunit C family protein n=1 Tax=Vibrio lentus TaxID=136468 RepID=UPI000C85AE41|nr:biotin-dependent carboxyltransferase family protein [Vibrio lentus]PMG25646.1 allophanate hydrolase [Vibrio lentus]PMH15573.1 allophanate hydrolase [Vibrio lentus]PMJ06820.1 allophanate hydrolase [Vibrio lentus]PMK87697.1 allophanate hydrolase [Vibrio lentus]PMN14730.1 allophanate hydrolase [Vibrio lentus]
MVKPTLTVLKPGPMSLIQDFGRFGVAHLGLTQGGPVDDYSYSWANHLLQNPVNLAALEVTLGQCAFKIDHDCEMSICGGDLQASLDGHKLDNWSTFQARAGQILSFGLPKNGLRAYLAIKGGFDVPVTLNSRSTVTREKIGGLTQNGEPCQQGQKIAFSTHPLTQPFKPVSVTFRYKPNYNLPLNLRIIEGYQCNLFSESVKETLYSSSYRVDQNSNRMGYRLSGEPVASPDVSLLSEGIALGAIQIPQDGQPIVLLNDRQTIGGYPKIGCIARIDLPRLAQAKPGHEISFSKGDRLGLQDVWCQWAQFFGY